MSSAGMISRTRAEPPGAMSAVAYDELLSRLEQYGRVMLLEREHEPLEIAPVSPELILVAPPEVAVAAREALPEPEPFEVWLRRIRAVESADVAAASDWEYVRRRHAPGLLFAAACVLNAAVPVALLIFAR